MIFQKSLILNMLECFLKKVRFKNDIKNFAVVLCLSDDYEDLTT